MTPLMLVVDWKGSTFEVYSIAYSEAEGFVGLGREVAREDGTAPRALFDRLRLEGCRKTEPAPVPYVRPAPTSIPGEVDRRLTKAVRSRRPDRYECDECYVEMRPDQIGGEHVGCGGTIVLRRSGFG